MTAEERIKLVADIRKSIGMQEDIISMIQSGEDVSIAKLWQLFDELVSDIRRRFQPPA